MTREELLSGLEEFIRFYKDHPNLPSPSSVEVNFYNLNTQREAAFFARELAPVHKSWGSHMLLLDRKFGPVKVNAVFWKSRICERVVTGTKVIPAYTVAECVEEIVEWKCAPALLGEKE